MAVSQALSVTQGTQSVTNNTSKIRILWTSTQTGASYNGYTKTAYYYVSVNGGAETRYSVSYTLPKGTTKTIVDTTLEVAHNNAGECTVTVRTYMETGISAGTVQKSTTLQLTTIPRTSTLTVGSGTLGTAKTLTVTRQSNSFTHSIKGVCGGLIFYIKADGSTSATEVKHSDCSIPFTPPLLLASKNTIGTAVTITYTLTTYNGSTVIGTHSSWAIDTIPSSVKPSCSIAVSDAAGYFDTYGAYIKGQSKFEVVVTPELAYSSPIASYNISANGVTYTSPNFTTEVLTSSGTLKISATVTDKRGQSGTDTESVTVLDYSAPQISLLKVKRCVSLTDGTEDLNGEFCQVTFSAKITALNNFNFAQYELQYKKTTEEKYTSVVLTDYANVYNVDEGTYIFAAESGSSYNIRLVATDDFTSIPKNTPLSTGEVIEHWRADGKGMGFGKIGEIENGADFGYRIRANNGFINILLEPETDLDEVIKPNTYYGENVDTYNYANCPVSSGTFTLEVASGGDDGQIMQTLTVTSKDKFIIYKRFYHSTDGVKSWGEWKQIYSAKGDFVVEYGSSGIWTYRKWNSGIAECWGTTEPISIDNNLQHGYLYYANLSYYFISNLFIEAPFINVNTFSGGGLKGISINHINPGGFTAYVWDSRPEVRDMQFFIELKGRWK